MDFEGLRSSEVFEGIPDDGYEKLVAIARPHQFGKGECLFLMGDAADRFYVVLRGRVELLFPMSYGSAVRDVPVESKLPGSLVGWSALVSPYRFTRSARAAEPSEAAGFMRQDILAVFDADPRIGCVVLRNVAEVVGSRLNRVEALWARELRRTVTGYIENFGEGRATGAFRRVEGEPK